MLDHVWLNLSGLFWWWNDVEIIRGVGVGDYKRPDVTTIVNYDRGTVTMIDPVKRSTWRYRFDEHTNVVLYKKRFNNKDLVRDYMNDLGCWKDIEFRLRKLLLNKIDHEILQVLR